MNNTNKSKEVEIKKEENEKETKVKTKTNEDIKPTRRKIDNIDMNELIPVRSLVVGGLNYKRKDGVMIRWENFGDMQYIEYGELIFMNSAKPKFLKHPYLAIDDDEVIEKLNLTQIYKDLADVNNIENLFKKSIGEISKTIASYSNGTKQLIKDLCTSMVKDGKLTNIKIIKVLEKELSVDLQELID